MARRAVTKAKTQLWEEFEEAMEMDFRLASKKFWTNRQTAPEKEAGPSPVVAEPAEPTANPV